ncbi:hypothetical protein HYV91_03015 [Candidatus Wolfebacteria bacterium]|nr:hypothetical protein [Candidatus Wolfebacteria bacterium]
MVNAIRKDEKILYQCEECKLRYKERETALKCETWCREHKSCNLEIIKYAEKEVEENVENLSASLND